MLISPLVILALSCTVHADSFTWTGDTNNEMTEATNWDPSTTPVNQDIVIFDGTGADYATIATGGSSAFSGGNPGSSLQGLAQVTVTSGQTSALVFDGGMRMRSFVLDIASGAGAVTVNGTSAVGQPGHSGGIASFTNNSSNTATIESLNRSGNGSGKTTTFSGSGDWEVTGNITNGIGTLSKTGGGTLTLSGTADGLSWTTATVSAGALNVSGTMETGGGQVTVNSGATLSGTGTINRASVINGTLSPGQSPGTLTFGDDVQLGADGNLNWQIHDAAGVAGTGYDLTLLTGPAALDLSDLSVENPFNINLWSLSSVGPDVDGDAINFDAGQDYEWLLFDTENAITGFSEDLFAINIVPANETSGFSNAFDGTFGVSLSGDTTDLVLTYTAVPEPSSFAGIVGLLSFFLARVVGKRRRHIA